MNITIGTWYEKIGNLKIKWFMYYLYYLLLGCIEYIV